MTSNSVEDEDNEFASYIDKDTNKLKLLGLLTDDVGVPISATIFDENTNDTKTVSEQIDFLSKELNLSRIIIVGDRGMLKGHQISELPEGYSYITAISRTQVETLIKNGLLFHDLFCEDLHEVEHDNKRYIMRLNHYRRDEIRASREDKIHNIKEFVKEYNLFLADPKHKRSSISIAFKKLEKKCDKLNLSYVKPTYDEENITIAIEIDQEKKEEIEKLDGCYCLITDIPRTVTKEMIHSRYKGLSQVESAFKTIKTNHLELIPIYVKKKESTTAHVLITTLAYSIVQELNNVWHDINMTTEEGITQLDKICYQELSSSTMKKKVIIPTPDDKSQLLLDALKIKLPIRKT